MMFIIPIAIEIYLLVSVISYIYAKFKSKKEFGERTKYKLLVSRLNLIASIAMLLMCCSVMGVALDGEAFLIPLFFWIVLLG
jgi:L-asparagine transporter-like permease